ncbi:MAG: hypothetical protein AB1410_01525 [Acidobacteriota bacterium]
MNESFHTFIEKFKVPEILKNHIHKIFSEKEILILNYLAENEENGLVHSINNKEKVN